MKFQPKTNQELKKAVNEYCNNKETKYGHINKWDVSLITDMSYLFSKCHNFNEPLYNWDTSKVKNMSYMFYNCHDFNQLLNNWNILKVKNMIGMFSNCKNKSKLCKCKKYVQQISNNKVYDCEHLINFFVTQKLTNGEA